MIGRFSTYSRYALCLVLIERSLADPTFPCWLCMVLVHEYSRAEFSHDEPLRWLQEALNSSHQLVKLLFWQDLLPSHPFPWPSWGHPADTQNPIGAQPTSLRAAGTSETRTPSWSCFRAGGYPSLRHLFRRHREPACSREPEGKLRCRRS